MEHKVGLHWGLLVEAKKKRTFKRPDRLAHPRKGSRNIETGAYVFIATRRIITVLSRKIRYDFQLGGYI